MRLRLIPGAFALASAVAYLVYAFPPEGPDQAITAWNLLIIPAAIYLGARVAWRGPLVGAVSTTAGVIASLLWAFAYASRTLEPWWIALAAAWWLGLAWLLRGDHRSLARFTLLLGLATVFDLVVTALDAPMPLWLLGAFKLPLTVAWTLWVGLSLVRDPAWDVPARTQ